MNDSPRHSVSVAAAVVNDDGHVLAIQRRDNGHWEPPGGVLELDETITDGLRREVHEETGLEIELVAIAGVYKNMKRGIIALVFRCRITGGTATPQTGETTALRWLTPTEIPELMDEAYAVRLLDAITNGPPAIRSHDGQHVIRIPSQRGPFR
jgi:ADP-ribose pyrophosphatase YjhB (NUDIX family)